MRCQKSRRICLEARAIEDANFSIHIENSFASGKTKRPRGPRSNLTLLRLDLDLQTRALGYYLNYHLQTLSHVPNLANGLPECVSQWKLSGQECSMVDLAISSMALAIFGRIQKHPRAIQEASARYYNLLRVVQERINRLGAQRPDEREIDACLLTVFLMGRYENAIQHPGDVRSKESFAALKSWSHHDGAIAILKVWYDHVRSNTASFIVKQTRRGLIKSCLLRNILLPAWMRDGACFNEQDLELVYDRVVVRVVDLHHASMDLQTNDDLRATNIETLNKEARELNRALQDWATHIPSTCSPRKHMTEPHNQPRTHFYSPMVYSYPKSGNAGAWAQHFSTNMLINSSRLRILNFYCQNSSIEPSYELQRSECSTQIRTIADKLAATVPFCLERFKVEQPSQPDREVSVTLNKDEKVRPSLASLAIWPLTVAASLDGMEPVQQKWFRSELARLGRIVGDGILECAETSGCITL